MRRTSATAYDISIKTGSHSGTEVVSLSGTVTSNVDNLRYIVVQNFVSNGSATATGYIDNMKFYNNITDADSAGVSNAQTYSIFSETDTGKDYIWSGSAWTEVS
jgi:hypothetical protein